MQRGPEHPNHSHMHQHHNPCPEPTHPTPEQKHNRCHSMLLTHGSLVLMDKVGEETANGDGERTAEVIEPIQIPAEAPLKPTQKFFATMRKTKQGTQWGVTFDEQLCTGYTEPPLEPQAMVMVTPSLVHIHYITSDAQLSSRLSQWAEQVFLCQICGQASVIAISKHQILGPIVICEQRTLLLPKSFFTRHHVHVHTHSSDNQTLSYANFKMKMVKNFASRAISVPVRIRAVIHRFTTFFCTPDQSVSSEIADIQIGMLVLCVNVLISIVRKLRALQAPIKKLNYPVAVMLQEVGKVSNDFVFHPLYASYYDSPQKNPIGTCIVLRRLQQVSILEVFF